AGPHLRDLIQGHPGTEPLGKHRVGRQPAADPNVEARTVLRVIRTNKRQVLDLVGDILAGIAANRGLELAWQVIELATGEQLLLDSADGRGGVDNLVGGDTGDWGAQDDAGNVAATEVGVQPNGFELVADSRDILDAAPVQLDVVAVGEVRGVAGVVARNLADDAQLLAADQSAVEADAHHEVVILQLLGTERGGSHTVEPRAAVGIKTDPCEAGREVLLRDGVEALLRVGLANAVDDAEAGVFLLNLLVVVERSGAINEPLALRPGLTLRPRSGGGSCSHGEFLQLIVRCGGLAWIRSAGCRSTYTRQTVRSITGHSKPSRRQVASNFSKANCVN